MNKNRVKGAINDVAGKVERCTGEVVGNDKMRVKGAVKQVEGKIEKASGNARDRAGRADKR